MPNTKKKEQPIIINNVIGGQPQQYQPAPVSVDMQKRKNINKYTLIVAGSLTLLSMVSGADIFGMESMMVGLGMPLPAVSEFIATMFWMIIPSYLLVRMSMGVVGLVKKMMVGDSFFKRTSEKSAPKKETTSTKTNTKAGMSTWVIVLMSVFGGICLLALGIFLAVSL